MSSTPRPHTAPPELAKDVLGKLDNARVVLARARAVARRGGLGETDAVLARLEAALEAGTEEVQTAVRADIRRLLSGGAPSAG